MKSKSGNSGSDVAQAQDGGEGGPRVVLRTRTRHRIQDLTHEELADEGAAAPEEHLEATSLTQDRTCRRLRVMRSSAPALRLPGEWHSGLRSARAAFASELEAFPASLREVISNACATRIRGTPHGYSLGELTPWLMADLVGLTEKKAIHDVAVAWLHIYSFTTIVDDLIDRDGALDPTKLIGASLLLQRGISQIIAQSKSPSLICRELDEAFLTNATAAVHELVAHRKRFRAFADAEVASLGQKVAVMRVCMAAFRGRAEFDSQQIDRILSKLGAAFQLLDDLSDWREDYEAGNLTYPLTIALQSAQGRTDLNEDVLLEHLVKSGALTEVLQRAMTFVGEVIEAANPQQLNTPSGEYLVGLQAACRESHMLIHSVETTAGPSGSIDHRLGEVRQALVLVAQSS